MKFLVELDVTDTTPEELEQGIMYAMQKLELPNGDTLYLDPSAIQIRECLDLGNLDKENPR